MLAGKLGLGVTEVVEGVTGRVTVPGVGGGWIGVRRRRHTVAAEAAPGCRKGAPATPKVTGAGSRQTATGRPARCHASVRSLMAVQQLDEHVRGLTGQLGGDDQWVW